MDFCAIAYSAATAVAWHEDQKNIRKTKSGKGDGGWDIADCAPEQGKHRPYIFKVVFTLERQHGVQLRQKQQASEIT